MTETNNIIRLLTWILLIILAFIGADFLLFIQQVIQVLFYTGSGLTVFLSGALLATLFGCWLLTVLLREKYEIEAYIENLHNEELEGVIDDAKKHY